MTYKSFESFSSLWLLLVFTKKVSVFYFMVVDVDKKCQERKKEAQRVTETTRKKTQTR